jgi:hypothetical protein
VNLLKATVNGLRSLRRPEEVAEQRGKAVHEVLFPRKKKQEDQAAPAPAEEAPAAAEETANDQVEDHTDA